jgi:hypothetical protein
MEIFSEEQNPPDGREGDRESELPLEESTSHSSGPSEIAAFMMDEPSSGIPSEVAGTPHGNQNFIQESENLEDLDILISAASNRRKIVDDKVQHELPILDVERQVTEQRQILLSPFNEQSTPTAAMVL